AGRGHEGDGAEGGPSSVDIDGEDGAGRPAAVGGGNGLDPFETKAVPPDGDRLTGDEAGPRVRAGGSARDPGQEHGDAQVGEQPAGAGATTTPLDTCRCWPAA